MGSMKKIMGMLPGMNQYRDALEAFDEKEIDRQVAIVRSMTKAERKDPKILDGSRRQRIAKGSGTTVQEVNSLMERFAQAKKMMQSAARGGMPGMPGMPRIPGMPGMPGGGYTKKKSKKARGKRNQSGFKKGRSGNPAKRKQQELAAQNAGEKAEKGSAFGIKNSEPEVDLDTLAKYLR